MINDLRKKRLKLRPVTYLSGSQGSDTDIPHAYIWSPHLVPKPKGCFRSLSSHFVFVAIVTFSSLSAVYNNKMEYCPLIFFVLTCLSLISIDLWDL